MSQSARFALKVALLLAVIAGVFAATFFLIPPDAGGFFQASVVKSALLKNTPSPRVILIGGSNVAFGIDSELMEARLGLPVVNMGMHGGIGESSYREVAEYLRPGDIVILMPEYLVFASGELFQGNDVVLAQWIEYDLTKLRLVRPSSVPVILLNLLQTKANRRLASAFLNPDLDRGVYVMKNFNAHGDFIGHVGVSEPVKNLESGPYLQSSNFERGVYEFFERFNLQAQQIGAAVYFEFPASRALNCKQTGEERLREFYGALLNWTTIPVLTPFDEICYPNSYFYDTNYHLNGVGRQVMTERVIKDLLPYLP
ncbi:MAG: hypothetical protein HFACDABA_02200 [Anaerolineales bacterium]|nr:hypothetical protein [Anaerolineales bacterium]